MRACIEFYHPSNRMARQALRWSPVMEYGTAVTQYLQHLSATTQNNHLLRAPTMEDAQNVLSHMVKYKVIPPSRCGTLTLLLLYLHSLMAIQRRFTQHVEMLTSNRHTVSPILATPAIHRYFPFNYTGCTTPGSSGRRKAPGPLVG